MAVEGAYQQTQAASSAFLVPRGTWVWGPSPNVRGHEHGLSDTSASKTIPSLNVLPASPPPPGRGEGMRDACSLPACSRHPHCLQQHSSLPLRSPPPQCQGAQLSPHEGVSRLTPTPRLEITPSCSYPSRSPLLSSSICNHLNRTSQISGEIPSLPSEKPTVFFMSY